MEIMREIDLNLNDEEKREKKTTSTNPNKSKSILRILMSTFGVIKSNNFESNLNYNRGLLNYLHEYFSAMMPFNLFIYSRRFVDKSTFPIPFDKIIIGLACLLGPLSAGFILRRCKPSLAEKILRVLKPACLVVVLFTMAGGMYTIRFVFTYILPNMIMCSILLPIVGFILGAGTSLLLRRPIREVKTISIETGIQNVAIAAGVIRLTYPYPDADMVSSTVMWTMLGQFFAVSRELYSNK